MRLLLFRQFCLIVSLTTAVAAAPEKWADEISKLTQDDSIHSIEPGAVVFVGSSSIKLWSSLAADFPGIRVINRGFGGSELADSVYYADKIILPYRPKAVVLYAGDNDIAAGKSAEIVAADFKAFREKVHHALPDTHIYYLSIKYSPSRAKFKASMRQANQLIAADCAKAKNCTFVDVNTPMLNAAGEPRPELFQEDLLHLQPASYAIWTKQLLPLLQR